MSIFPLRLALYFFLCLASYEIKSEEYRTLTLLAGNTPLREEWNLVNDSEGIYIYTRDSQNSDVHEAMVTTEISAPPWRVNAVLADYKHHSEFMPYVSETVVLRNGSGKVSVFQQLDFSPVPITDRYYTIRIVITPNQFGPGSYQICWSSENEKSFIKEGQGIPVLLNTGCWKLRPIRNGTSTSVNYYHLADPGGWLPTWVINKGTIDILPRMIKAVKKRVTAPQYEKFMPH